MTNDSVMLIVGASPEEFDHAKHCLPTWRCVAATLDDNQTIVSAIPEAVRLILVYARKTEKQTLAICQQLRNAPGRSDTPILLVVSRYMIGQTHPVKRMGNAGFIMTPFNEQQMRERIAKYFDIS